MITDVNDYRLELAKKMDATRAINAGWRSALDDRVAACAIIFGIHALDLRAVRQDVRA